MAQAIHEEHPEWVFLYQYANTANPKAHYEGTGPEIWRDCPEVTHFVAGLGTSGTLLGVGRFLKERNPEVEVWAVEPPAGEMVDGLRSLDDGYIPPIFTELGGPELLDRKTIVNPEDVDRVDPEAGRGGRLRRHLHRGGDGRGRQVRRVHRRRRDRGGLGRRWLEVPLCRRLDRRCRRRDRAGPKHHLLLTVVPRRRKSTVQALPEHLHRSSSWNGLSSGDPVTIEGVAVRGATWVFKAHVRNERNGAESVEVVGGRPGEHHVRSFLPGQVFPARRAEVGTAFSGRCPPPSPRVTLPAVSQQPGQCGGPPPSSPSLLVRGRPSHRDVRQRLRRAQRGPCPHRPGSRPRTSCTWAIPGVTPTGRDPWPRCGASPSRSGSWLVAEHDVKLVVVACNTATAAGLDALRAELDVPVVGVIEPGMRALAKATRNRRAGVIGTVGTISSGAYQRAAAELPVALELTCGACPGFVEFVERGESQSDQLTVLAERLLAPVRAAGVDALLLGCTHYPFLARTIADVMGRAVVLVSSADETAFEVRAILADQHLATIAGTALATSRFFSSGDVEWFRTVGGTALRLRARPTWERCRGRCPARPRRRHLPRRRPCRGHSRNGHRPTRRGGRRHAQP